MKNFCVIGHPITHSKSPQLHEAGFLELEIDANFEAIDVPPEDLKTYEEFMKSTQTQEVGVLWGKEAKLIFKSSGLTNKALSVIWNLADRGQKGMLVTSEFIMAIHLITLVKKNYNLPVSLPSNLSKFMVDYESNKLGGSSVCYTNPKDVIPGYFPYSYAQVWRRCER